MAGRGPAPKAQRYRRTAPVRGDWTPSPDGGWQHDLPKAPTDITPATERMWQDWFRAWWAGHWTPDDVPMLRFIIRLYDRVLRGDLKRLPELRQWLDAYGITPKGQQDRRWQRPEPSKPGRYPGSPRRLPRLRVTDPASPYAHLRVTEERPTARERLAARAHLSASERFKALDAQPDQDPGARI